MQPIVAKSTLANQTPCLFCRDYSLKGDIAGKLSSDFLSMSNCATNPGPQRALVVTDGLNANEIALIRSWVPPEGIRPQTDPDIRPEKIHNVREVLSRSLHGNRVRTAQPGARPGTHGHRAGHRGSHIDGVAFRDSCGSAVAMLIDIRARKR